MAHIWRIRLTKLNLIGDFSITLFSNFGITFLGALGGIITARILGPEGRGELATAAVWTMLLSAFAQIGLSQALTYSVAREPDKVGDIFVTAVCLWAAQSVIVILVGLFLIQGILAHLQPNAVDATHIYLLSAPPAILSTYLQTITRGLKRFQIMNALRFGGAISVFVAILVALMGRTHEARHVALLVVTAQSLTAAAGLIVCLRLITLSGTFSWQRAGQLLKYGSKSLPGDISWLANYRLDQFIMSLFLSLNQLGYYAVAVSYATILFPVSGAFAMILFPTVAGEQRVQDAKRKIIKTLKLNFIISVLGAVALALLSPVAIPLLFSTNFGPATLPAIILLAGTILFGCNYVLTDGLRGLGYPLASTFAELIGMIVTVGGLIILLPLFGAVGASIVSVMSYGAVLLILFWRFGLITIPSVNPHKERLSI